MSPQLTRTGLSTKLSILVTCGVLFVIGVLGVYFDSFLRASFQESTERRMQHGYEKLAEDLRDIESNVKLTLRRVEIDKGLIASIDLINKYQDKNNYNRFLIDEEKKRVAELLFNSLKLSSADDALLYDASGELVAMVIRTDEEYELAFVSYAGNNRQLWSRNQTQIEYHPNTALNGHQTTLQRFYLNPQPHQGVDNHFHFSQTDQGLRAQIRAAVTDPLNGLALGHIELSYSLEKEYFGKLSKAVDMDMSLSFDNTHHTASVPFSTTEVLPQAPLTQTDSEYLSAMRLNTQNGPAYFVARLNKSEQITLLDNNRQHLAVILILILIVSLGILRVIIHRILAYPLAFLMHQINRIERQDYEGIEALTTRDELGIISENINNLARTVSDRERSLEASKLEMAHLSNHDSLTSLPNRRFFEQRLNHALDLAKRNQQMLAVFFLDLDQFKMINDTLGHDVGDELLTMVAEHLSAHVRNTDTLARIGGDEFNILIEGPSGLMELEAIAAKYLILLRRPFYCRGIELNCTTSIGISLFPHDGQDSVTLIKHADLAMYKAKDQGGNQFYFYSSELSDKMRSHAVMTQALKQALETKEEFELYYQPKVSTSHGKAESIEALIRWHSAKFGLISPAQFIPLAEETGLIVPLGKWVLEKACSDFISLTRQFALKQISVNVSIIQLQRGNLLKTIQQCLEHTGIQPEQLELEITESYFAHDTEESIRYMERFRSMGLSISIDDFGTGYSSMSYLRSLPITRLKMDKSFVDGLPHDPDSRAVSRTIISLAKNFRLAITAEGVETEEQLTYLQAEGCDEIQGYYFSKPLPLKDLRTFLLAEEEKAKVIPFSSTRKT